MDEHFKLFVRLGFDRSHLGDRDLSSEHVSLHAEIFGELNRLGVGDPHLC